MQILSTIWTYLQKVFSVATNLIPFLPNYDANLEEASAQDYGVCVIAEENGEVSYVDSKTLRLEIKTVKKGLICYLFLKEPI